MLAERKRSLLVWSSAAVSSTGATNSFWGYLKVFVRFSKWPRLRLFDLCSLRLRILEWNVTVYRLLWRFLAWILKLQSYSTTEAEYWASAAPLTVDDFVPQYFHSWFCRSVEYTRFFKSASFTSFHSRPVPYNNSFVFAEVFWSFSGFWRSMRTIYAGFSRLMVKLRNVRSKSVATDPCEGKHS